MNGKRETTKYTKHTKVWQRLCEPLEPGPRYVLQLKNFAGHAGLQRVPAQPKNLPNLEKFWTDFSEPWKKVGGRLPRSDARHLLRRILAAKKDAKKRLQGPFSAVFPSQLVINQLKPVVRP